jgi:predicted acyltransferase
MSDTAASPRRLASLDQFRGYTVAGMFVVNYLGHFKNIPNQLQHNQVWFSYADTIMPSFLFISGVSYRLSLKRRLERDPAPKVYAHALARGLALILLSLVMYGAEDLDAFRKWSDFSPGRVRDFFMSTLKANLWEVLAIIGACQILLLPIVNTRPRVRIAALVALPVLHAALSSHFNYNFVYGRANPLDGFFGVANQRAWDGGCFGLLMWSVPMLAGTLVWDLQSSRSPGKAAALLLVGGLVVMLLGYALSAPARLWELTPADDPSLVHSLAQTPVLPPSERAQVRTWEQWLPPAPFTDPGILTLGDVTIPRTDPLEFKSPAKAGILANYWIMDKRVTTASFTFFALGFAITLYALFIVLCDLGPLSVPVFRTFGTNPLTAYVIHYMVAASVHTIAPDDSPSWWCWTTFALFFLITWILVRGLEKQRIYIKL